MSYLANSASYEYACLCYASTAIINSFTLTVRGLTLKVRIWRIRTSKVDPRPARVNLSAEACALFTLTCKIDHKVIDHSADSGGVDGRDGVVKISCPCSRFSVHPPPFQPGGTLKLVSAYQRVNKKEAMFQSPHLFSDYLFFLRLLI